MDVVTMPGQEHITMTVAAARQLVSVLEGLIAERMGDGEIGGLVWVRDDLRARIRRAQMRSVEVPDGPR